MVGIVNNPANCEFCPGGIVDISLVILIKRILMKKKQCTWEQKTFSLGEFIRSEHVNAKRKEGIGDSQPPEPNILFARRPVM